MLRRRILILLLCGQFVLTAQVQAYSTRIPVGYQRIANTYQVPVKVYYAMLTQESGLTTQHGFMPWPWTLNIAGKSRRYKNRKAAYQALRQAIKSGTTLVDIGAGQVNWHYHHKKLGSLWQSLEPYHNLKVAAQILRNEYERSGQQNWWLAVGRYHSPGQKPKQLARAKKYERLVKRRYRQLI
ncbi:MAG: lytic transglycosylase domain-containing protein [gamma proteobacterium symbiont of Lucinoma myriamae]|nr:lytic transglycosylase domain-containing protein [gamma proteobacterium symbiont of Lucinoma myriamae]